MAGRKFRLGMLIRTPLTRIILICVCGWHQIGRKETKYEYDVETTQQRSRFGKPTSFLDHENLGCTQRQCEISKDIVDNYRTMFESRISVGLTEKLHTLRIFVFLHGLMIWRVMQRNLSSDIVSCQIRRLNNSTKYLLPVSMTITLKKKKCNVLDNFHKYAPKLF